VIHPIAPNAADTYNFLSLHLDGRMASLTRKLTTAGIILPRGTIAVAFRSELADDASHLVRPLGLTNTRVARRNSCPYFTSKLALIIIGL
jgi:hypothetical protein